MITPLGVGRLIVMKKFSKHTPEQIVRKLEQADKLQAAGSTVAQVCRQLQINKATFARWRKQYGTMSRTEAREFQKLREENARLKRLLDKSRIGKGSITGVGLRQSFSPQHVNMPLWII